MRARLPIFAFFLVLAFAACISAQQRTADPEQAPLEKLSGTELVGRLLDANARPRAFYELHRRNSKKDESFEQFERHHSEPTVVVCPQENGASPLYMVLYGFFPRSMYRLDEGYPVENPEELFPSPPGGVATHPAEHPSIAVFTADGRIVAPFGGNNVLDGKLADVNGDGLIERVEVTNYGVEGIDQMNALMISTVKEKQQPILTLVLNWGADEWIFRMADREKDGIQEIEAGPRTRNGLKTKAVWKWNAAKHAYTGPTGGKGDHFRVIDGSKLWEEIERLKAERTAFPKDPDAVSPFDIEMDGAPSPEPQAAPQKQYVFRSLKGASDAEVMRFMLSDKSEFDRENERKRSRLPEDFWTADAKATAQELLNINRSEPHQARYQIALDGRDKAQPPARCTVAFSDSSSRCYNAVDAYYFLRVDPDESYIAYASSWAGGAVFYNAVHDAPAFDLRLCPLKYQDARKISDVIWWLDRSRSRKNSAAFGDGMSMSTADGFGSLTLRAAGQLIIDRSERLWAGSLSDRWREHYTPEVFLNFASYLIARALPERLGKEWTQFAPQYSQDMLARQASAPKYAEEERIRLQALGERFLSWCTPGQEKISFAIAGEAADLAATFVLPGSAERLQAILTALPPPSPRQRTFEEISADRNKLLFLHDVKENREEFKRVEQRRAALDAEMKALLHSYSAENPDNLRKRLDLSLRKLVSANSPAQLEAWAISKRDGFQWACQRLATIDRARYAKVIEALMRKADGKWARQFYNELAQTDPVRAAEIAQKLPPNMQGDAETSAYHALREAEKMPDEAQRSAAIIKVLHTPKSGYEQRRQAIDLLVPPDAPLRYTGKDVDEALLKLLEPAQGDDLINFSLEYACRALARRGRTEYFDRIAEKLNATRDPNVYHGILAALAHLTQADPVSLRPRLAAIIKPQLSKTDKSVSELLWTIWAADLREFQADLERLATAGPDEYEDRKANSYGGKESPVAGRFHFARKVATLWREPDALTRARLLIAFTAWQPHHFVVEPEPERLARMKIEMARAAADLSVEDKKTLAASLDTLSRTPLTIYGEAMNAQTTGRLIALARKELGL